MRYQKNGIYRKGRILTRAIFLSEVEGNKSVDLLIDWLNGVREEKPTTPRGNGHVILQIKFNVSDLSDFEKGNDKSLAMGIAYKKPDDETWASRDWHIINSDDSYHYCRNDQELKEKGYFKLFGTHKEELTKFEIKF
jgi:hypothetical protein